MASGPIRGDLIEQHGDRWTEPGLHVGNGPFQLNGWSHGQNITLTRNPHYHGEPATLETIFIDMIADESLAFLAYKEGELDVVKLGPAEIVQVRGSDVEAQFLSYAELNTVGVFFNLTVAPLDDLRVREALALAFDRVEYAQVGRAGAPQYLSIVLSVTDTVHVSPTSFFLCEIRRRIARSRRARPSCNPRRPRARPPR